MAHAKDTLLDHSAFAVADVYEYQHAKMYMTYFCQGVSGKIYQIKSLYRDHSPTIIENPLAHCQVSVASPAAASGTPLATVVHYDGPGVPTVHLFFLGTSSKIEEIVWVNGEKTGHNFLNIQAATNSDLSVISWRQDKGKTLMKIFFQAPDGSIQEYDNMGSDSWQRLGDSLYDFDSSSTHTHEKPLSGTSLAFVNLSLDRPNLRGFWQAASSNAIVEGSSQGLDWTIKGRTVEVFPPHIPIAAAWEGKRTDPKTVLYHIADRDIFKTVIGNKAEKISTIPADEGSRIAVNVSPSDGGVQIIASGAKHIIRRVFPKNGEGWQSPHRIVLETSSPLAN
ncbi:hypothetical protein TWF481_010879 [Arthrobotrys musiformis]|uniref:Fucose-specific lectin n=1 Tax=Arthrobotrys musiformis TaxID=47236 RepID=A0AAV9W3X4_9PEZI